MWRLFVKCNFAPSILSKLNFSDVAFKKVYTPQTLDNKWKPWAIKILQIDLSCVTINFLE